MRWLWVLFLMLLLAVPAQAQPHPGAPIPGDAGPYAPLPVAVAPVSSVADPMPTGTLLLVLGGLSAGAGVLNLATAPACRSSLVLPGDRSLCVGLSVAFGLGLLGAGIPMVVVGAGQREAFRAWTVQPVRSGAVVGWGMRW